MLTQRRIATVLGVVSLVALALASPAKAQASRTWVSGVGDDFNPCSRTAPCKTFAGAISKTAARGQINCLDPGGYGGVTITKSLTINCGYTEGGVLVSGTNAIVVNAAATDVVTLRGLDIHGFGTGLNGIRVLQARRVKVYNTNIFGFVRNGFDFEPLNQNAKALLDNVTIEDNTGNAVLVAPPASGQGARVTVRNSEINNNGCGVAVTSRLPDPTFNFSVNCGAEGGAGGSAQANVFDSTLADHNNTSGVTGSTAIFANGGNALIRIGANLITGNSVGMRAINVVGSSGVVSFGDNYVAGNTNDGSPNLNVTRR